LSTPSLWSTDFLDFFTFFSRGGIHWVWVLGDSSLH
jgi:hypothetical protein